VLETKTVSSSAGAPTMVAEIGAALVGDTAVFGPTGPLLGTRYRLEGAPAAGGLSYTRVLADYRRYVMPVRPLSLAVRVLHSGRFGPDGDDPRLLSSFLGSQYLVRGHLQDLSRCQATFARVCGDDLLGSRMLVGNLELRFPIWGLLSRELKYGPVPADGFVFADGGLVWARAGVGAGLADPTRWHRRGISSLGGGVRVSAGGLPVEIAAIRALDGPAPRWLFDLGFRVGF
jgi:outer membrane protein assembly factor BamA